MTDIYLRSNQRNNKPIIAGAITAVVLILFIIILWPSKKDDQVTASEDQSTAPADTEMVSAEAPAAADQSVQVSDRGKAYVSEARRMRDEGKLQQARTIALRVLNESSDAAAKRAAEEVLDQVNVELVMTPRSMPEKTDYTIASGDTLAKLANKFNTTVDLIQKGNQLSGANIRVGDRLRIFSGEFSIEVDKSDNILLLRLGDQYFKRYNVGTGKFNKTPVGDFQITEKIPQPTWWRPDGKAIPFGSTNNVLGTHWLSLDIKGYGIHGTWEPESIGQQASAGCIRLLNEEVAELYALVPSGTPVTIRD